MPRKGTRTLRGWPVSETSCGPSCYSEKATPALFKISACWDCVNLYKSIQGEQQHLRGLLRITPSSSLCSKKERNQNDPDSADRVNDPDLSSCVLASASCETKSVTLEGGLDKQDSCIKEYRIRRINRTSVYNPIELVTKSPCKWHLHGLHSPFMQVVKHATQFTPHFWKMENWSSIYRCINTKATGNSLSILFNFLTTT